jgi:hypothetical protein
MTYKNGIAPVDYDSPGWTLEDFVMVFKHNLRLSFEVSLTFLLFFCRDVEEIGKMIKELAAWEAVSLFLICSD